MDWEYQKIYLNGHHRGGDDIELLSEAGRAGWELVTVTANSIAYLKRALEDDTGHVQQNEAVRPSPKYRDPATGDSWSGRGRMASWLKQKRDIGEDIESYRISK